MTCSWTPGPSRGSSLTDLVLSTVGAVRTRSPVTTTSTVEPIANDPGGVLGPAVAPGARLALGFEDVDGDGLAVWATVGVTTDRSVSRPRRSTSLPTVMAVSASAARIAA